MPDLAKPSLGPIASGVASPPAAALAAAAQALLLGSGNVLPCPGCSKLLPLDALSCSACGRDLAAAFATLRGSLPSPARHKDFELASNRLLPLLERAAVSARPAGAPEHPRTPGFFIAVGPSSLLVAATPAAPSFWLVRGFPDCLDPRAAVGPIPLGMLACAFDWPGTLSVLSIQAGSLWSRLAGRSRAG